MDSCSAVDVELSTEALQHDERTSLAAERIRARGGEEPRGGTDDLGETEPLEPIDYSRIRIHMLRVGCGSIQCPLDAWTVYARDRRASRFFRDRTELGIPIVSDVGRAVFRCPQV